MSLPPKVASAYVNSISWQGQSPPTWQRPYPPCPPASGIDSPNPPLEGCAACWHAPLFPKLTLCQSNFGQRTRCSTTCPRDSRGIGGANRPPTPGKAAWHARFIAFSWTRSTSAGASHFGRVATSYPYVSLSHLAETKVKRVQSFKFRVPSFSPSPIVYRKNCSPY